MKQEFFFYDLETSGLMPREDRIMQFAGQRTSLTLEPIGEPVNILVKMSDDVLPKPGAIRVTGITPQMTLMDGVSEPEFCRMAVETIFAPGTVAVGYNTVRFDDEFMRATLWRNFYDPYEWEWKDGRSRWDMLDVVRMTRALRPEGIEWPVDAKGKATNRLELLTKANGLSHEHAHDALSDVYATIAVARLIRERQPELFNYLFKMRNKREVARLTSAARPFVYVSGRYSAEHGKATVVVPLGPGRNGNVLVYDLRQSPEEVLAQEKLYPTVKELCLNKCPAVAPLAVLDKDDGWAKIGLSKEVVDENYARLLTHPELVARATQELTEKPEFPPAWEPEGAIYEGFLGDRDRIKAEAVRNAGVNGLADFHPDFDDARLPELLLHYKGRNFPAALSETEAERWEDYRRARLGRQAPQFLEELEAVQDDFVREELKLYYQAVM